MEGLLERCRGIQVNEKILQIRKWNIGLHKKKADKIRMVCTHNRVIHTTHMNSQPK